MNIIKPRTLSILHKTYRFKQKDHLVISPVCVFSLLDNQHIYKETDPEADFYSALGKDIFDLCMPKGSAEFIIQGSAYSNTDKPVTEMVVSASLGDVSKRIYVLGDRNYQSGLLGVSPEQKQNAEFSSLSLSFDNTFGGPGSPSNPVGKGLFEKRRQKNVPGANLVYNQNGLRCGKDKNQMPAAFGPTGVDWPNKIQQAGTYDENWFNEDRPGFPQDIDFHYFNRASSDQYSSTPYVGGMSFCLTGMHPKIAKISGVLPGIKFRVFVQREESQDVEDSENHIDTVWFFPDREIGVLVGRSVVAVTQSDAEDVSTIMIAYEGIHDQPKSLEHYRWVLNQRTDPKHALKHVFNESQLMPLKTKAEQDEIIQQRIAYHAKRSQSADDTTRKIRATIPELNTHSSEDKSDSTDNGNETLSAADALFSLEPEQTPTADEIKNGDFDLTPYMTMCEKSLAHSIEVANKEREKAENEIKQAKADNTQHTPVENNEDASKKALSSAGKVIKDPVKKLEEYCNTISSDTQKENHQATADSIIEQCDRLAASYSVAEKTVEAFEPTPASKLLREYVIGLINNGQSLSGRNLSGADLSELDLSGMDLTDTDLSNSCLSGANMQHCTLLRTNLKSAYAKQTNFSHASIKEVNLSGINGQESSLDSVVLEDCQFLYANMAQSSWLKAKIKNTSVIKSDFNNTNFSAADIQGITLVDSCFSKALFVGATIKQGNISQSALDYSQYTNASLAYIAWVENDLSHADFSEAVMNNCSALKNNQFKYTIFSQAVLSRCGFGGVNFYGSNFNGGVFGKCDYSQACLKQADMTGSCFAYTLMNGADMSEASIMNADFLHALCRKAKFTQSEIHDTSFFGADLFEAEFDKAVVKNVTLPVGVSIEGVTQ